MDKTLKEMTIEELINYIAERKINNIYEEPQIIKAEKILNAKLGQLTNENIKNTNNNLESIKERLGGLGGGISQLNQALRDGIKSSEELGDKNMKHANAIKWLTVVLAIAGIWQGCLLNTYTKETQKLVLTTQEQLDLQLQPALMVTTYGPESIHKSLYLVNIGHGAAFNIKITSDDKNIQFVDIPNIMYYSEDNCKNLYYISSPFVSSPSEKDKNHDYNFEGNKELIVTLNYENLNNKKYFTKVRINKEDVYSLGRGRVKE
jgi:hypothetical protein